MPSAVLSFQVRFISTVRFCRIRQTNTLASLHWLDWNETCRTVRRPLLGSAKPESGVCAEGFARERYSLAS